MGSIDYWSSQRCHVLKAIFREKHFQIPVSLGGSKRIWKRRAKRRMKGKRNFESWCSNFFFFVSRSTTFQIDKDQLQMNQSRCRSRSALDTERAEWLSVSDRLLMRCVWDGAPVSTRLVGDESGRLTLYTHTHGAIGNLTYTHGAGMQPSPQPHYTRRAMPHSLASLAYSRRFLKEEEKKTIGEEKGPERGF